MFEYILLCIFVFALRMQKNRLYDATWGILIAAWLDGFHCGMYVELTAAGKQRLTVEKTR